MINYTWDIVKLDCYPEAQGKTNVAFTAYFTLTGSDGTYESNGFSSVSLVKGSGEYIPYADLTHADVIAWVQQTITAEELAVLENSIAWCIAQQIAPSVVSPALPWVS